MAYDAELADRLSLLLAGQGLTSRKMFGGLAFLVHGHLAVAASGEGGLLVRAAGRPGSPASGGPGRPGDGYLTS